MQSDKVIIQTNQPKQVVDITVEVEEILEKRFLRNGLCFLFAKHTTCALTTADLDPGTDLDMLEAFQKMVPPINFRHPHNPSHAPDHILSSLIGPSVSVPVENGIFVLGTWQRIVLVEFNGPRERNVVINFV